MPAKKHCPFPLKPGRAELYLGSNYSHSEITEGWKNGHVLHMFISMNYNVKETWLKGLL